MCRSRPIGRFFLEVQESSLSSRSAHGSKHDFFVFITVAASRARVICGYSVDTGVEWLASGPARFASLLADDGSINPLKLRLTEP